MRHLATFFLIGALLLGARRLLEPWLFPPALTVHVDARASDADVERAIDEAILLEQALARGGALLDPVVREQLLRTLDAPSADDPGDEASRVEHAVALGVHRADPVVRRRLAFQSEQLLVASAEAEQPADAILAAYARVNATRYARPARTTLQQVFVSRDLHGDDLARTADGLRDRLPRGAADARELAGLSDPSLLPATLEQIGGRELDARFGAGFAAAIDAAPAQTWAGPLRSAYGLHFVRVTSRTPSSMPPLDQIRARVLGDYRNDRRSEVLRARLREMRAHYDVDVRRQPS